MVEVEEEAKEEDFVCTPPNSSHPLNPAGDLEQAAKRARVRGRGGVVGAGRRRRRRVGEEVDEVEEEELVCTPPP